MSAAGRIRALRGAASGRYGMAAAVIGLAAIAKFASAPGQSFLLSVFVDELIADTGTTRTGFSVMYGAATVFSALTVLVVGRAVDSRGVAPVWAAVAIGLAAGCLVLSTAAAPVAVLAALCLMRGFGQGSFPLLGTVLVASRFAAARGRAIAISSQGVTVATALLPAASVALISAYGWRPTLQLLALALVVVMVPLALAVRSLERARPAPPAGSPGFHLRESFTTPGVPLLLAILSLPPLVITAIVVHAVSIGSESGMTASQVAFGIGAMAVATVLGSLGGGAVVDRTATRVPLVGMCAGVAAACLLLLPAVPALTYAALLVLGVSGGLHLATAGTAWARTYGVARLSRLQSLGAFGQIFGAAAGPLPPAVSLGLLGSYSPGLVALATLAVGCGLAGLAWPRFAPEPGLTDSDPSAEGPHGAGGEP